MTLEKLIESWEKDIRIHNDNARVYHAKYRGYRSPKFLAHANTERTLACLIRDHITALERLIEDGDESEQECFEDGTGYEIGTGDGM